MKNINPKIAIPVGIATVFLLGVAGYFVCKSIANESKSNGEDDSIVLENEQVI